MREICTSGLMSGEGKRNASLRVTAPFLDSTLDEPLLLGLRDFPAYQGLRQAQDPNGLWTRRSQQSSDYELSALPSLFFLTLRPFCATPAPIKRRRS
jgi:hypothetical protein